MTTTIIDTDTLTTLYSLTTSTDGNGDIDDTLAYASMTATTVSTTISTSTSEKTYAEDANRYVDSLSQEQICMLEEMVSNRYDELANIEEIKVYKKV
jgi:hypothetical protein